MPTMPSANLWTEKHDLVISIASPEVAAEKLGELKRKFMLVVRRWAYPTWRQPAAEHERRPGWRKRTSLYERCRSANQSGEQSVRERRS
jgi:hypothetical protein